MLVASVVGNRILGLSLSLSAATRVVVELVGILVGRLGRVVVDTVLSVVVVDSEGGTVGFCW